MVRLGDTPSPNAIGDPPDANPYPPPHETTPTPTPPARRHRRRGRIVQRHCGRTRFARRGGLRRHLGRRHRRRPGQADGQVRRHRLPRQAPRRPLQRRPRLDRHRQQGGHRRPLPRVLPPRLATTKTHNLEMAETRRVRQPGPGTTAIDGDSRTMWIFEPHVAEQVFEDLVARARHPRPPRRMARPRRTASQKTARPHHLHHHAQRQDLSRARCSSTPPTKAT